MHDNVHVFFFVSTAIGQIKSIACICSFGVDHFLLHHACTYIITSLVQKQDADCSSLFAVFEFISSIRKLHYYISASCIFIQE